jgi:16S rRNA (guanine527-N7)-methyltransferase
LNDWRRGAAVDLTDNAIERLIVYEDLLRKWQQRINLVSDSSLPDIWNRHFRDSHQLLGYAETWTHWVDLGSGAGFPGMVIALTNSNPDRRIHLIESDKRKAAFLREVSRETSVPVEIHSGRIEATLPQLCSEIDFNIVSARGLAPMPHLTRLAMPALQSGALGLFLKGKDLANELTNFDRLSNFNLSVIESQSDRCAKIVLLRWRQPVPDPA